MGILKQIADKKEPLRLAKQVEEDVLINGLELNAAMRKANEEYKNSQKIAGRGKGIWD